MANYTAALNQWVQIATNTEDNTITAPPSPDQGHWFGVKMLTVTGFAPAGTRYRNIIEASPGQLIEDSDGKGPAASTEVSLNYEYASWTYMGTTWWRMVSRPLVIPELFDKEAGSTPISSNTPIPLVYDPTFDINPTYFQENAGNIECIRPFSGYMDLRVYFEFILPANNQDASGQVLLTTIAGTPAYKQGAGAVSTVAHSRSGTYYMCVMNKILMVAKIGDIVGLVGNDDAGQSGTSNVVEDTGLIITAI